MSGLTVGGKTGSVATVASSAAVLPFTGGHSIAMYVVLTAVVCGLIVVFSKVAKRLLVRG